MALLTHFTRSGYLLNICNRYSNRILKHASSNTEEMLARLGLSKKSVNVIVNNSAFHPLNESKVNLTIETLQKCQFGSDLLGKLIEAHPLVLLVDASTLESIYIKLLAIFTKKYVYNILLRSPEVLNEDWDVTNNKLKYLQEEMCVSNLDIVNYGVLKHSFDYIRVRHEFLKRTGRYKYVSPKLNATERHKINPSIDKVLNTPAEYFSSKVAGVSLIEFESFQQLYLDYEA